MACGVETAMTYRVIVTPAGKGLFDYRVVDNPAQGRSSSPLFAACRQLHRMGADPEVRCAMFHGQSKTWAVRCSVGYGARQIES